MQKSLVLIVEGLHVAVRMVSDLACNGQPILPELLKRCKDKCQPCTEVSNRRTHRGSGTRVINAGVTIPSPTALCAAKASYRTRTTGRELHFKAKRVRTREKRLEFLLRPFRIRRVGKDRLFRWLALALRPLRHRYTPHSRATLEATHPNHPQFNTHALHPPTA